MVKLYLLSNFTLYLTNKVKDVDLVSLKKKRKSKRARIQRHEGKVKGWSASIVARIPRTSSDGPRFVLAGPSGFTRLSLVFLLRECGARMRRIFLVSPFFSRSNGTGEREIGVSTVTAPFSHFEYGQIGQMRYFEPPLSAVAVPISLRRSRHGRHGRRRRTRLRQEAIGCHEFFLIGVSVI